LGFLFNKEQALPKRPVVGGLDDSVCGLRTEAPRKDMGINLKLIWGGRKSKRNTRSSPWMH
jgi:hypothetical protein